jgi:sugar phosphate isomerase/epimerase
MNNPTPIHRIAVCSWSLQPASPADLLAKLRQTGLRRIQLALDPLRDAPAIWGNTVEELRAQGCEIVSGMLGCVGEDYSTLESIKVSGGLAPDHTWEQNLKNIHATALLAKALGLGLVTFHAGFVPDNESDPGFGKMVERLRAAADVFAAENMLVGLETGQETAVSLRHLLQTLRRPNVKVNFDPANMLLYNKGNPIDALKVLGPYICQVHIKDARRTRTPGTWGEEVPAGTGEVDWEEFFDTLKELGYRGDFVIEREAGDRRVADIGMARQMIEKVLS